MFDSAMKREGLAVGGRQAHRGNQLDEPYTVRVWLSAIWISQDVLQGSIFLGRLGNRISEFLPQIMFRSSTPLNSAKPDRAMQVSAITAGKTFGPSLKILGNFHTTYVTPSFTVGLPPGHYRAPVSVMFFAGTGFFFTYLSYQAR